jgi:Predicted pyridoxal phosphate-dependent enzyme apparently involved in regulation of cell wall biogenesis
MLTRPSDIKTNVEDLAIFGAAPAFKHQLHVGRPNIGKREAFVNRVNDLLDRKWLTNDGPCLQEFEQRICQLIDVKHCVAVCNATIGLEILTKAIGLSGEVILPSFTFVALAHALQWHGITPVFCDIDPATHNIDPLRVEELITGRTTGIIGVHLWGRPCDVERLTDIARRHKLKLLFDAAHAFACSYRGRMIGGFGNAEVFSFHATKFVNTFEGGAIVTNDDEPAAKIRLMRNFGFAGYDIVSSIGTNGKMTEVSAAMGLTSLESMDSFIEANRRNYHLYRQQLEEVPGISLLRYQKDEKCNYQYVVIEVDEAATGVSRDILDDIFWAENVLSRRYFYPGCHRMEPYLTVDPQAGLRLPQTERLANRVLCLPTGSAVSSSEITAICKLVEFVVQHAEAVKRRLSMKPIFRHPWRSSP